MSKERRTHLYPTVRKTVHPILGAHGLCGTWGVAFTDIERVTCRRCIVAYAARIKRSEQRS